MEETKLNELATQTENADDEGFTRQDVFALIGGATVIYGIGYVGMRVMRNAVDARRLRKLKKAEQ